MQSIRWGWTKRVFSVKQRRDKRNLPRVYHVRPITEFKDDSGKVVQKLPERDFKNHREHDTVLISGDGATLPDEVKQFESWGIGHDIFAVNKSLLFFQRPILHWTAVDAEESAWFAENLKEDVLPNNGHRLLRHTIGICTIGYDAYWEAVEFMENEIQARLWVGNTGYFAMLAAIYMGYKKIILAGIPLDTNHCWYEHADEVGPHWVPETYTTWMDFKMKVPEANRVKSLGGYSAFILGNATKEWINE
jgi:hypothetical protein